MARKTEGVKTKIEWMDPWIEGFGSYGEKGRGRGQMSEGGGVEDSR